MVKNSSTQVVAAQEELQQSIYYLEYLKEQIGTLKEQYEILELAINEHNQAIDTLKDLKKLNKNNEILIPIGADSLMFAKVADPSKVILNIGAGIAKEEKINDAVDKLTSRIDNIENNKKKIQEAIENLQDQATKLSASIEERYKEYREDLAPEGSSGSPNVS